MSCDLRRDIVGTLFLDVLVGVFSNNSQFIYMSDDIGSRAERSACWVWAEFIGVASKPVDDRSVCIIAKCNVGP
ncbi:hypothetical protein AC628_26830 [Bradyrhizobium sp. NAS96.2]|nr:hypothetical protein AC628_26830 [Bradyrhizobium sp. NAS96.2]